MNFYWKTSLYVIAVVILVYLMGQEIVESFRGGRRGRRRHSRHGYGRRGWRGGYNIGPRFNRWNGPLPGLRRNYVVAGPVIASGVVANHATSPTWYNKTWSFFGNRCRDGCTSLGNGVWGCQYPTNSPTSCMFARDCDGCGGY